MAGKTDHDLILSSRRLHAIPEPEGRLPDFYSALADATEEHREAIQQQGRCLPGAREAVERLAETPGFVQSVVTGNIQPTARAKLAAFNLASPIDFEI